MKSNITKFIPQSFMGKLAVVIILLWVCIAILSPFIANNKPIVKTDILTINPIIPYHYADLDVNNSLLPPLSKGNNGRHFLGTDKLGRDVAAGMVNGARVAFLVAFITTFIALVIGILIGLMIGFYGDKGIKKNLPQTLVLSIVTVLTLYYLYFLVQNGVSVFTLTPLILAIFLGVLLNKLLSQLPLKKYGIPLDIIIQRLFELNESIPGLYLILAFISIVVSPTIYSLAIIIAILYWMGFARHVRSETIQIREEDYVKAAKASGLADFRLIGRHILPNVLPPLLVVIAFSISGVILLESTLSFLGIGLPLEEISWGKLLSEARRSPKAWWLAVFPGIAIFLVLYAFNTLGDFMDPRKN